MELMLSRGGRSTSTFIPLFWRLFVPNAAVLLGAGVMIVGGLVAAFLGVNAEQKSLEDVAMPLSMRRPGTRAEGAARTL